MYELVLQHDEVPAACAMLPPKCFVCLAFGAHLGCKLFPLFFVQKFAERAVVPDSTDVHVARVITINV